MKSHSYAPIDERAHLIHDAGWAFSPCVRELPEGLVPTGTPKIDAAVRVADLPSVEAELRWIPGSPTLPLLAELGIVLSRRSR